MKQIMLLLLAFSPWYTFSQIKESFNGPEITSQNPWQGDLERFSINPAGHLQFISSPEDEKKQAFIYLPISYAENMTWDMEVKLDFKTTDSNNLRFYTYSTGEGNQISNSYFIQVGNNNGQISFYSSTNQKQTPLISGRKNLTSEPASFIHIRLILKENKEWSLYTRKAGEKEYYFEGKAIVPLTNIRPSGNFNIMCRYVKSRISYYYIDNIQISPQLIDFPEIEDEEIPPPAETHYPTLTGIDILSLTELQFIFDQPVDITEAAFHISDIGNALQQRYTHSQTTIYTRFPKALEKDKTYTISWKGLKNEDGNSIPEDSWDVILEEDGEDPNEETPSQPDHYPRGAVLINEIMADPKGLTQLPETEYVELHNTTGYSISLKNWSFLYGGKPTLLKDIEFPPNSYLVLYREGRDIYTESTGQAMPLDKFPNALANGGKDLQLTDANGNIMDEITYRKAAPGRSWERKGDELYLSTDLRGGTPGSKNSSPEEITDENDDNEKIPDTKNADISPGDIIFNELLPEPYPDGSEYIELYNRTERHLSLSDLVLAKRINGELSTSYPINFTMSSFPPYGYIVLTKNKEGILPYYFIPEPENIAELKLPALANNESTLVLFLKSDSTIIDEITYSAKWHDPFIKSKKGVALERIDPNRETQDSNNWTSAAFTHQYGTPGYKNSQYKKAEEEQATHIGKPVPGVHGDYSIYYELDQAGYSYQGFIYNLAGSRVAIINNHELAGTKGSFIWDGKGINGNRLPTGPHILFIELYHPNGKTKQFKKVFLVR